MNTMMLPLAIVIAKQTLHASDFELAILQSSLMIGLILSLFYGSLVERLAAGTAYVLPRIIGSSLLLGLLIPGANQASGFTMLLAAATMIVSVSTPQLGVFYQAVYPDDQRGRLVGTTRWFQLLTAAITSWVVGDYLKNHAASWPWIYALTGVAGILLSLPLLGVGRHERPTRRTFTLAEGFRIVSRDRNFCLFLAFQFLLGIANMAGNFSFYLYVNKTEYLGLDLKTAALVTGAIPPVAMLLSIRPWGTLFDRIGIVGYRVITNVFMAMGFLIYVLPGGIWTACIGVFVWSMGRSGGQLAWTIGILQFAGGPHRSPVYMRIHTFLTGVRGVVAPFVATWLISTGTHPRHIFLGSFALLLLSSWLTWKYIRLEDERRPAAASSGH